MPKFSRAHITWIVLGLIILLFILAPHAGLTEACEVNSQLGDSRDIAVYQWTIGT